MQSVGVTLGIFFMNKDSAYKWSNGWRIVTKFIVEVCLSRYFWFGCFLIEKVSRKFHLLQYISHRYSVNCGSIPEIMDIKRSLKILISLYAT